MSQTLNCVSLSLSYSILFLPFCQSASGSHYSFPSKLCTKVKELIKSRKLGILFHIQVTYFVVCILLYCRNLRRCDNLRDEVKIRNIYSLSNQEKSLLKASSTVVAFLTRLRLTAILFSQFQLTTSSHGLILVSVSIHTLPRAATHLNISPFLALSPGNSLDT